MVNCVRCKKVFRNQYDLTRHMSRKFKCIQIIVTINKQNELPAKQNELPAKQNELPAKQNEPICEFCFKNFFNTQSLTRHYNICKSQDDPLRRLEIESGITPVLPTCPTECRFCNKEIKKAYNT